MDSKWTETENWTEMDSKWTETDSEWTETDSEWTETDSEWTETDFEMDLNRVCSSLVSGGWWGRTSTEVTHLRLIPGVEVTHPPKHAYR